MEPTRIAAMESVSLHERMKSRRRISVRALHGESSTGLADGAHDSNWGGIWYFAALQTALMG
jgi:hypothetical protein